MSQSLYINAIGAGPADSEAAYQTARRGIPVEPYEMRGGKVAPQHKTDKLAELVYPNSLRDGSLTNAADLLKEEIRRLDSVIMKAAESTRVPVSGVLAADRDDFSQTVTDEVTNHPLTEVTREEITEIPTDAITAIASDPLTSDALAEKVHELNGSDGFCSCDAAVPIVDKNSIDMGKVYSGSRYDKGEAAYPNYPMTKEGSMAFYEALVSAEEAPLNSSKKGKYFEGCTPIKVMAECSIKIMLYGPTKPVGLEYPDDYKGPRGNEFKTLYVVVQLHQDNVVGSLFSTAGFQTHLKWGEQKRIFRMVPGLGDAEFIHYSVVYRNSYMNSPDLLTEIFATRQNPDFFFAGRMIGVKGYVESAASGLVVGINAVCRFREEEAITFLQMTTIDSFPHCITHAESEHFRLMNVNFGIARELGGPRIRDKEERYEKVVERALNDLQDYLNV